MKGDPWRSYKSNEGVKKILLFKGLQFYLLLQIISTSKYETSMPTIDFSTHKGKIKVGMKLHATLN